MTRPLTIRKLKAKLCAARRRVRLLELMLYRARGEQKDHCDHVWVRRYPSGMRDNGEFWYVCTQCGVVE